MEVKFNKQEIKLLYTALTHERYRWEDIILSDDVDSITARNYELDMIILHNLQRELEGIMEENTLDAELSWNKRELGFVIEALDNEIDNLKRVSPLNFFQDNFISLCILQERVKNEAISEYGEIINEYVHYDRSKP